MSDSPIFTNIDNRAIPGKKVRGDLHAALSAIPVPSRDDINKCFNEHVIPKVEQRLADQNWSPQSIEVIIRKIGDLIEIVPGNRREQRVTRVRIGFRDTIGKIVQAG